MAKPKEAEEALRAAAGMAKEELSSVAVAMADGRTDGMEWVPRISKEGIRRGRATWEQASPTSFDPAHFALLLQ